jgi:hypothetical protein
MRIAAKGCLFNLDTGTFVQEEKTAILGKQEHCASRALAEEPICNYEFPVLMYNYRDSPDTLSKFQTLIDRSSQ